MSFARSNSFFYKVKPASLYDRCLTAVCFFCICSLVFFNAAIANAESKIASSQVSNNKIIAKAKFKETTYDFGTVSEGSIVSHDFEFTNVGNSEYAISRLVSGCGCTAVSSARESLAPGESSSIKVSFDTNGFSGLKTKVVRVFSNDYENPEISLTLSGKVESDVEIRPSSIHFGEVPRGVLAQMQNFEIITSGIDGVKVSDIRSYSKFLKIEPVEVGLKKDKKTLSKYRIILNQEAAVGELRDRVIVSLSNGQQLSLPVLGRVVGAIAIDPPQISYGILQGDKPIEKVVDLNNRGSEAVDIISIVSDTPSVTANFETIVPGKKYKIHVKLDPTQVKSDLRALLEIRTSSSQESSLYLSVFGVVPPKLDY